MVIIKGLLLFTSFAISVVIGLMCSGKYKNRVNELKELKTALTIMQTKMRYTYEPIPEIFQEIANSSKQTISLIFLTAIQKMEQKAAGQAWQEAIEETPLSVKQEDKTILKGLSKLLGKTDVEGQISQIELTIHFLSTQIEKAEIERAKNEKMYKTLGVVGGCAIVIFLI